MLYASHQAHLLSIPRGRTNALVLHGAEEEEGKQMGEKIVS
jgi:hypothetical protein